MQGTIGVTHLHFDQCRIAKQQEPALVFQVNKYMWLRRNDIFIKNVHTVKCNVQQRIVVIGLHIEIFEQYIIEMILLGLIESRIDVNKKRIVSWQVPRVDLVLYYQGIAGNQLFTFWYEVRMLLIQLIRNDHSDLHQTVECSLANIFES